MKKIIKEWKKLDPTNKFYITILSVFAFSLLLSALDEAFWTIITIVDFFFK